MEMELLLACVSVLFAFVLCSFACTLHKNMDVFLPRPPTHLAFI